MSVGVIIPAGGAGRRMGLKTAKQYMKIEGVPVIDRTLSVFNRHPQVAEIVVVLPGADVSAQGPSLRKRYSKVTAVVAGGKERTLSVRNGFNAFTKRHSIVLVHDAVRPFVRPVDITNVIAGAKGKGAATLAVPVKDTIKIVNGKKILGTPNRKTLWHTLTPQGFRGRVLREALDFAVNSGNLGTDECQLVEKMGRDVYVVEGDYFNIKITTGEDRVFAGAVARLGR